MQLPALRGIAQYIVYQDFDHLAHTVAIGFDVQIRRDIDRGPDTGVFEWVAEPCQALIDQFFQREASLVELFAGPLWKGMSITIMGGLALGTLITLGLIPVLYWLLFGRLPGCFGARAKINGG
ncbi:hypothetical protein AAIM60_07680 [Pseudomonas lijiangensis]|uniref:hypothetical protein n=1 Tax=Pseudomonas lijiangensis TaxID=2995658 RepID=UPI0031BB3C0E